MHKSGYQLVENIERGLYLFELRSTEFIIEKKTN